MNISILGVGAIGSLWAYHLSNAGHKVSLFTREATQQQLTIKLDHGNPITAVANNDSQLKHCDLLLVTVKAWQVETALTPLLQQLDTDTIIVFMHNGMGAIDTLSRQISRYPVVQATTTHGALIEHKDSASIQVRHTGKGATQMGGYNLLGQRCHFIADVFHHALPSAKWHENITPLLWNKLAINCAINPLTAIHQCNNGHLASAEFEATLSRLCSELALVMQNIDIPVSQETLLATVYQIIDATADNYSSMHQDIAHARPTEIDYITGYLLKVAKTESIDVPTNQNLYNQLKQLELKNKSEQNPR